MNAVLVLLLTLAGGPDGSVMTPVRFAVEGPLAEFRVLEVSTEAGESVGYAQRDGDAFVFIAPALKPEEKVTYTLKRAESFPDRVVLSQSDSRIEVRVDGKAFTTYHYGRDLKKPYLYPVLLDGQHKLTRAYPMEDLESEEGAQDHHHHRSWWVSYGEVNDSNFWHESDSDTSQQRTDEILEVVSGPVFGKIRALNSWNHANGKQEVVEEREYLFYADSSPDQTTDMKVTFRAENGEVIFRDTKEGGMCSFRMNPAIDESHGNGLITNSEGGTTVAETWGKPARWIDYTGNLDGKDVGVSVMDNPENLRHPSRWHIRDYGLYSANCFGLSYFTKGEENGDYTIPADGSLVFRYRVLMHFGKAADIDLEGRYQTYTRGPKVRVAKQK